MRPDVRLTLARRAASIAERAEALRREAALGSAMIPDAADEALRTWAGAFAPGDLPAFDRRLAWDGLTRADARRVVNLHEVDAFRPPTDWTTWLEAFGDAADGVLHDIQQGAIPELDDQAWPDEPPFIELWLPAVRAARQRLGDRLAPSVYARAHADAHRDLERQLARELALVAERATYADFDRFRTSHDGPKAYLAFVLGMLSSRYEPLWLHYPVMARQLASVTRLWVNATAEWLTRLDADIDAIGATFLQGSPPGAVAHVEPALSDPHHGRRRVMILRLGGHTRLVYKPRDVKLEAAFGAFVSWTRREGLDAGPRALTVLPRDGYGWVEYAKPAVDRDPTGTADYFRKAGATLCLAHLLRGRDLHMGNVVATEDGPALIDVEMLLQPERRGGLTRDRDETDAHPLVESCLTTGLLSHFDVTADGHVVDVGGLRGAGRGQRSRPRRVWHGRRTDDLRPADETQFDAKTPNRVICGGSEARVGDYAAHVLAGFDAAYDFVMARREALLGADGPLAAFASCQARVIPRPTDQYAMLAATLLGPRYQQDGAQRSAAMDILSRPFRQAIDPPGVWPLLQAERAALEELDIPCFSVRSDDTTVVAGSAAVLDDYFTDSGLAVVRARIGSLSAEDRDVQHRVLTRALAESPASRLSPAPPSIAADASPEAAALAAACWLGQVVRVLPPPEGPALYDGALGPAILFHALARVTGEVDWARAGDVALEPVYRAIEQDALADLVDRRPGAGDGVGSVVHGLALIAGWSGRAEPLDAAEHAASVLPALVDASAADDVLSGTAGAVLALLSLDALRPATENRRTIAAWARRLLERGQVEGDEIAWLDQNGRRLVGFAHGAAGIGYALHRAGAVLADDAITDARAGAMRFWRAAYQPAQRNWPIARSTRADDRAGATMMTAWCHGAPGVAIAEAALPETMRETAQLEAALNSTLPWVAARADHLCCGTMGRAEVLFTLGRWLGVDAVVSAGVGLARHAVARAFGTGHVRLSTPGFEYRVFDPGFFRGLAGIGYVLARFAAPDQLPSVLAFEPPAQTTKDEEHG